MSWYLAACLLPNPAILVTTLLSPVWLRTASRVSATTFLRPAATFCLPRFASPASSFRGYICRHSCSSCPLVPSVSTLSGTWAGHTREADLSLQTPTRYVASSLPNAVPKNCLRIQATRHRTDEGGRYRKRPERAYKRPHLSPQQGKGEEEPGVENRTKISPSHYLSV